MGPDSIDHKDVGPRDTMIDGVSNPIRNLHLPRTLATTPANIE